MSDGSTYEVLTRLARLLQAEDRTAHPGLQPVQLHALQYLTRCNRYSDRPAAVAEYLGITKGTASQTLRVLEQAGLVVKAADPEDRRVVHLRLTARGKQTVRNARSRRLLGDALKGLPEDEKERLEAALLDLLRSMQHANGSRSFGICRTCRHFQTEGTRKFRCGLTTETLTAADSRLICREHEALGESPEPKVES